MATMREAKHHGKMMWCVEYGMVEGKRRRGFFATETEAKKELAKARKDRRELGNAWTNIEPARRYEVLNILREIKKHNTTLPEVWRYFKEHNGRRSGITIEDAVEMLLEQKKEAGVRPLYLRELGYGLAQFAKDYGERDIATIQDEDLRMWLSERKASASTKATLQRRLSALFSWAARKRFIETNPVARLEVMRVQQDDPEIFDNDQCRALVRCAYQMDTGIAKYFALALFLGIRPEECQRLTDDAIDLSKRTVTVSGQAAKTRDRRIVTITDPAFRILEKTIRQEYKVNFRKRLAEVRRKAGIKKWPKDVLRHTAASHFHNLYTMDEATKQLGHSADVMLQHYRQLVSREETDEWLGI